MLGSLVTRHRFDRDKFIYCCKYCWCLFSIKFRILLLIIYILLNTLHILKVKLWLY